MNYRLKVIDLRITSYFLKTFSYKLQSNIIKYVIELHVINCYSSLQFNCKISQKSLCVRSAELVHCSKLLKYVVSWS